MILLILCAVLGAGFVWLLVTRPWLAPWGVVVLFSTTAELRLRVSEVLGVSKDVLVVVMLATTAWAVARGRTSLAARIPPPSVWVPLAVLVILYVADLGGNHGSEWFFGTRLLLEPLLLLAIGSLSPDPRRTLQHLVLALCVILPVQAVLVWIQQAVGPDALVYQWGYAFGSQVRLTSGGDLRSPGTFEEAFSLAALAVLGACVAATVATRGQCLLLWASIAAVLAATQVRTAVLQLAALTVVLLLHKRRMPSAVIGTLGAAGGALLAAGIYLKSSAVPGGTVRPLLFTLNGRFEAWAVAYQGPETLLRGNGVGQVGAGLTRARSGLLASGPRYDPDRESAALFAGNPAFIDSTWGQVLSDVGLLGVLALLVWVVAHASWLRSPLSQNDPAAWLAVSILVVSVVDWVSRTTLGSYPTGFSTLYMLGLATGAAIAARGVRRLRRIEVVV
ncbi:hypothetical protein NUM3379_44360 [Kineococcus sp. NUM-3379]